MTADDSPQLDVDGNAVPTGPGAHFDSNGNVIPVVEVDVNAAAQQPGFVDAQGEWLQVQATFMDMPGMPSPRYLAFSHEELKSMVEQRNNPGQVGELGAAWHDIGASFVEFDAALWKALLASQQHWTGATADRARAVTADIGTWFATAGRHAQLAGNRLAGQAEVAAWARDTMPKPVGSDRLTELQAAGQQTDPLAFPAAMGAVESQERARRDAHHQAAMIVEQYDRRMAEYGATMPAFDPPPPPGAADSSPTGWSAAPGPDQHAGPATVPQGPGVDPRGPGRPPPSGPTPGPSAPMVDPTGPTGLPALTASQQATTANQGQIAIGGGPAGGAGGGGSRHATPHAAPNAGPFAAALPGTAPAPAGGAGSVPGRLGARGTGALGGMPPGSRRAAEEDEEHQTADYLVEPDPDGLFGVHEQTVRPVIGES